jgi:hypothetical protein
MLIVLLALFIFGFCWCTEFIMLATFLGLMDLSLSHFEFYSFLVSCIHDYFSSCSIWIISLSILCNAGLWTWTTYSLSLS